MSNQKYTLSAFAPLPLNCNILQPKRLNSNNINGGLLNNSSPGKRSQIGKLVEKGQISLGNNAGTNSFLRNSIHEFNECGLSLSLNNGEIANLIPCKSSHSTPITKRAPTTMAKRNARERNRVKQVNQGFQTLRQHIPDSFRLKKMSKVDTLRCALDYIRNLERILQEPEGYEMDQGSFPLNGSTIVFQSTRSAISPSTSISFSSEDDELFVQALSSGGGMISLDDQDDDDLEHEINANVQIANTSVDKIRRASAKRNKEMQSEGSFSLNIPARKIMLHSQSECYNDENKDDNNLEDLEKVGIKIEICPTDENQSLATNSNYRIDVTTASRDPGTPCFSVENNGMRSGSETLGDLSSMDQDNSQEKDTMGITSQTHLLRNTSADGNSSSDTENNSSERKQYTSQ